MLIINADDWGGWPAATDAAAICIRERRINSVSAMVFMEDSERAAKLARELNVDVGLHLNIDQAFTGNLPPAPMQAQHNRLLRFYRRSKYAQLIYNPRLQTALREMCQAQTDEFMRLYCRNPSHWDGHHHLHLCANMLISPIIPSGERVRLSFSPDLDKKSFANRIYRNWVNRRLSGRYASTKFFFSLGQCLATNTLDRVFQLAKTTSVELMTHPESELEYNYLMSEQHLERLSIIATAARESPRCHTMSPAV